MSEISLNLSFPEPDIAELTFDLPGKSVNVLGHEVLAELAQHLDELAQRKDLAGLIISSAKPGSFIAGADVREFVVLASAPPEEVAAMSAKGHALFAKLANVPFVTVAAIHGVCLGGGAELAVWCDRRVMTSDDQTEFGFPEVKLGLFPGWGGTVRTPRLIGLANAVQLITSGEPINAKKAYTLGLACDVVAPDKLQAAAIMAIRDAKENDRYLEDRAASSSPVTMSSTESMFLGATASAMIQQETKGQYPAPMAVLELMMETSSLPVDEALAKEADGFAQIFGSPVNQALINVFFLTDHAKKPPAIKATPREIKRVGVAGAGIMGAGIASANVKRGVATVLIDASPESLEKGLRGVLEEAAYDKETKQPSGTKAIEVGSHLQSGRSVTSLAECDLVIEAIVENADVKQKFYAELESVLSSQAIMASNTSTIPITRLAQSLKDPSRFCGIHFFNPVRRMKLVEVIRGKLSSDETIATAAAYAKRIGKFPIVVNDSPGFLVNRLLSPYMNAALELITAGVSIKDIDKAAVKFGMPLGPIALYDLVGLDTAFYAGRTMYEAFPERFVASPILPALMKAGRLGQKNGKGFYNYQNKKGKAEPDPDAEKILDAYTRPKGKLSSEQVTLRLMLPMLLEATRVLEEGIVSDIRDVDLGLIYGLGFPPFQGGLLYWADRQGAGKLLALVESMKNDAKSLAPTPLLAEMAATNRKFYARSGAAKEGSVAS